MIRRAIRGMTLIEIIVGLAIFSAIGAIFVSFITSSSKEVKFSGDHFNAVILSQKVSEDILEELTVNPYGLETLGVDGSGTGYQDVVDGSSVFFSHLEDRVAPWGRIDPTVDGMLDKKMKPLYDHVSKFKFRVSGERLKNSGDGEKRNLLSCDLDYKWSAQTGRGEFNTNFLLFSPATARKTDLAAIIDQAAVDARIPKEVFNRPGRTVPQLAADIGENVDTILALGRISLVSRDFMGSSYYQKRREEIRIAKLKLSATPQIDLESQFALRRDIARLWYDLAKVCFQVVAYLEPQFAVLQSQGKFGTGAGTGFNPITFQQDLFYYRIIYEYIAGCIVQARYYFYTLLQSDLAEYKGAKVQTQILQRLMDVYRICAILPTRTTGMQEYKDFLKRMKDYSEGRNPFLFRMISQELGFLNNRSDWLSRFPNLKRIHNIVHDRIPEILSFIKKQTVQVLSKN